MKYTLPTLLLALLTVSLSLSAQSVGIRAGYVSTGIDFDFRSDIIDGITYSKERRSGIQLGVFADFPLGDGLISLQPELTYLNRGSTLVDDDPDFGEDVTIAFSNLDLGTLIRVNFAREQPVAFYLGAGPTFSYALNGEFQYKSDFDGDFDERIDFDEDENGTIYRTGLFLTGVAGLNFSNQSGTLGFFAEARYQAGLRDVFDDELEDVLSSKQNLIGLSAGILLPFGRKNN